MRLNRLDLNLLVYLNALLTERSVSKAARSVFLSQPAMSDALARLRAYFDDELLVRVGHTTTLTALGQSLLPKVGDVLIQIQSIASSKVEFDPANSKRKITIMASDYVVGVLLRRVIARVSRLAPGTQIHFTALTGEFLDDFERGRLDFLILPEQWASKHHPSESLYSETFTCAIWDKNRRVGNKLSFKQYMEMGHISVDLGAMRASTYEEWFLKRYGGLRKIEVVVPTFGMALQLVEGSERIATCHLRHARMYARQYALRLVNPPFKIPVLNLCLQWHKYVDHDPALIWFRGIVKSVAAEI
jgi:LysR family nod box-dependent transcriptional activator